VIKAGAGASAAHRFLEFLSKPEIQQTLATEGLEPVH